MQELASTPSATKVQYNISIKTAHSQSYFKRLQSVSLQQNQHGVQGHAMLEQVKRIDTNHKTPLGGTKL